jgi:SAM-dependent methyltransferase
VRVRYGASREAWEGFEAEVRRLIESLGARRVCEVGGGANPILPLEYVHARGLEYTLLDICESELAKAPEGYRKQVADIGDPAFDAAGGFDLVVSKMLAEHVRDGAVFHANVWRLLAPGGVALHFFPTLYAFPFVVNRLMPEWLSSGALGVFSPRDRFRNGKFPAYYSWCVGPTERQRRRLERVGFRVLEYRGYYGHLYYRRIPVVRRLAERLARYWIEHPAPRFTTYAYLIMQKPEAAGNGPPDV